jgi:cytoskeletal protein CcmA (bactofilin family)
MTCPSPITHSMYADDALPAHEAARLEQHATTCPACRARIEALHRESAVLRLALQQVDESAAIPRFVPPPRARDFVVLVLGVALIGGFSSAFWNTVGAAIPSGLRWLNPLESGELFERALRVITFIVYEGTAMWTATLNVISVALVLALAGWLSFAAVRQRGFAAIAASILAVVIALPSIGHAFERRQGTLVTVAADETIDDTLFAAGETVSIDGNVNGDLLAFGRSVTVRGNVAGNLVTGAETVRVEGTIGGSVIGGARGLSLASARIGRDLYGFGRDVEIEATANVAGNAIAFGENVDVDGRVGVDLAGFASTLTVSGAVEGDVEGYAGRITLLPSARVGGNVTAHVDRAGDLNVASGAVVGGTVDEQLVEREERRNRYLTVGYYVGEIVKLGATFLLGLLLLWVFPVLREVSLPNATAVVRSGGIGLAAAVTLPVAAVLMCITIVGIPLGILTFMLGFIGLVFSKPVIAQIIGRAVFRAPQGPPHYAATLIAGLVIVVVAINLPFIGGIANFVLTLVGFGVIVSLLVARFSRGTPA